MKQLWLHCAKEYIPVNIKLVVNKETEKKVLICRVMKLNRENDVYISSFFYRSDNALTMKYFKSDVDVKEYLILKRHISRLNGSNEKALESANIKLRNLEQIIISSKKWEIDKLIKELL